MVKRDNGAAVDLPTLTPESVAAAVEQMDRPRIDFDELSWGDTKRVATLGLAFNKAAEKGDGETIARTLEELEAVLAPIVLSVPRSWLVRRAPEGLDITQPGALSWLRKDRFLELVNLLVSGSGGAQDEAVNLPRP